MVLSWVDSVNPGADKRYRGPALIECTLVGCTIDSASQATQDGEADRAQFVRKLGGVRQACRTGMATADDGNGGRRKTGGIAQDIQQARWIGQIEKSARIGGIIERQKASLLTAREPSEGAFARGVPVWVCVQQCLCAWGAYDGAKDLSGLV